jgi:hypothetical protein
MVLVKVSLSILVTSYIYPNQKNKIVLHRLVSCDLGSCAMVLMELIITVENNVKPPEKLRLHMFP